LADGTLELINRTDVNISTDGSAPFNISVKQEPGVVTVDGVIAEKEGEAPAPEPTPEPETPVEEPPPAITFSGTIEDATGVEFSGTLRDHNTHEPLTVAPSIGDTAMVHMDDGTMPFGQITVVN
jgi:hypothetical protein